MDFLAQLRLFQLAFYILIIKTFIPRLRLAQLVCYTSANSRFMKTNTVFFL